MLRPRMPSCARVCGATDIAFLGSAAPQQTKTHYTKLRCTDPRAHVGMPSGLPGLHYAPAQMRLHV